MTLAVARAIFTVPPFPHATPHEIVVVEDGRRAEPGVARSVVAALRQDRVGGTFWDAEEDPWRRPLLEDGEAATLLRTLVNKNHPASTIEADVERLLLSGLAYRNPFTGEAMDILAVIGLLGHWRRLIDENDGIVAAFGFAQWKRDTVEPLLWDGRRGATFGSASPARLAALPIRTRVACWKARVSKTELATIEDRFAVVEVEDGFIRSVGLGADCVPPLSIVVDDKGVHYDPSRSNRLEALIQTNAFSNELIARAAELRALIVRHGIGKYGVTGKRAAEDAPKRSGRVVLVVGQVEDDRSVRFGSPLVRSNLALLEAARRLEPDAHIIYRPHPDVTAGHRVGAVLLARAEQLADEIDAASPISDLLDRSDALHTMTSLAGFEALLRGREVICHGQPFYAGWGLTRDLAGAMPRRTARPTIDELTAAVLLVYPRYLDPVTNLPCTPEILVMRLVAGVTRQNDALVPMRRLQGFLRRAVARIGKSI